MNLPWLIGSLGKWGALANQTARTDFISGTISEDIIIFIQFYALGDGKGKGPAREE